MHGSQLVFPEGSKQASSEDHHPQRNWERSCMSPTRAQDGRKSSAAAAPRHSVSGIKVPKIITGFTYFNCHYLPTWFVDHFVDRTVSSSSNLSEVFQVLCSEIPVLLRGDLQFS